ncbi:hypothetical protein K493DRAFT_378173 [Basidiobolus meristosporus CBS 931.73]|uniref:BHLH domain-containing protein n=1 Tax=Basidiobolus meristosporus CBS 931.73 TaxID=1314790 RepID=A0A1Y1Z3F7_9FUNG|nr:hypothetical protein K493DRAFT_378173 [Basidiobolus meristosporus CBS 931.73]|eukprot:ORY04812.1 hypothetical protein K493DRAFT_378173 [Basidiobolus meristosporus CBS 931.73]
MHQGSNPAYQRSSTSSAHTEDIHLLDTTPFLHRNSGNMEVGTFDPMHLLDPMEEVYLSPEYINLHTTTNSATQHPEMMTPLHNYRPIGSDGPSFPTSGSTVQRRLTLPAMGQMSRDTMDSDQRRASTSSVQPSPTTRIAKEGARGGRAKKGAHELLTEEEKRANHIASEQKRRQNIRIGFERLVDIVPTLNHNHRSESVILEKFTKQRLKKHVRELQVSLGEMNDDFDDFGP